jgi:hypothetical protein
LKEKKRREEMSKRFNKYPDLTDEQLLDMVEDTACEKSDGHFTLMRFTTGWKAMFETPDVVSGGLLGDERGCEYERIFNIPMEETMGDAIISAIYDIEHQKS